MPNEAYYLLIPSLTLIVMYAIWKGRGLIIGRSSIEVKGDEAQSTISVGRGMKIEGSDVGNVAGVMGTTAAGSRSVAKVDVLDGGRVKNSKLGDITGLKQDGGSGK